MDRIILSTASNGVEDATHHNLLFSINPQQVDLQLHKDIIDVDIIHGSKVWQQSTWDGRPRILTWQNVSDTSAVFPNVKPLVASVRSFLGEIVYLNFGTLDQINYNWPNSNTWKKCRLITLDGRYKPQSPFTYSELSLILQPEQ